MGEFIKGLFSLLGGGTVGKVLDIALEKTEDVDKRNALIERFLEMKEVTRRVEIQRVTVPWVDAVHKMGRQLFWFSFLVGVLALIATGHSQDLINQVQLLLSIAGGGGAYTVLKGRGQ